MTGAYIIRKSDGNYIFWDGQDWAQTHPPIEAIGAMGGGMDAPAVAHTGGHGNMDTGIGDLIPGVAKAGRHGEIVYHNEESGNAFYHPIDAAARNLGEFLESKGIDADPVKLIDAAITKTNEDHPEDNHLQNFYSPEHRKIGVSEYQGPKTRENRQHYISHGGQKRKITHYTNYHGENHHLGTFLDSGAIHFGEALKDILQSDLGLSEQELGEHKNPQSPMNYLFYPHITKEWLSYARSPAGVEWRNIVTNKRGHRGESGMAGQNVLIDRMKDAGYDIERLFDNLHGAAFIEHLPDEFFMQHMGSRRKYQDVGTANAVREMLLGASGHPDYVGQALSRGNVKQTINFAEHPELSQTMVGGVPLSTVLASDGMRDQLLEHLRNFSGFMKLFGRTTRGSAHKKLGDAVTELHTNETDEDALGLEGLRTHIGTVKTGKKGSGSNFSMGNMGAVALMSGVHPEAGEGEANSRLRHTPIPPELLDKHKISLKEESRAQAPMIRSIISALGKYIADSMGHETEFSVPDQLPTSAVPTASGMRLSAAGQGVPEHVPYAPLNTPSYVPSTTMSEAAQTAPAQTAPAQVATRVAQTAPAQTAQGTTQMVRPPMRSMTPEILAARANLPKLNDEQIQRILQAGIPGRTRPYTPTQVSQYRDTMQVLPNTPVQTQLTDYMKSEDRLVKAMESLQMREARLDDDVMRKASSLSIASEHDVSTFAKKMGIAPQDIRLIYSSKGDWQRLTKSFGYPEELVKVVKVTFGGE